MEAQTEKKWYVIKVHSGFENPVVASINQAKESLGLDNKIFDVIIPLEKQIRLKDGKRIEKNERMFPGSILVSMILDDTTWYAINNIEHVSGFLGSRSQAESLTEEEVDDIKKRMDSDIVRHEVDIKPGTSVKIIEGPFESQNGVVQQVDAEKGQATVVVSMLGRKIAIDLELFQIREI